MAWLNDFMKLFYDYDYSNSWEWDTDNLVNYDDYLNPWTSSTYSRDSRSYAPTVHGQLGDNREHYNYTLGIENKPEYKAFTDALLDKNGNFTEMGKVWAHDVDRLIGGNPNGFSSLATFYDENGNIRPTWEVTTKNAHGHTRLTFDNLRDYVNYIRNDQVLGPRHNGFLRKGTRYYWKDNKGGKHYINPELAKRYKELSRLNGLKEQNDPLTTWTDIEIGFDPNNPTSTGVPGNAPADRGSAPAGGTGRGSIRVGAGDNPNGAGDPNDLKGPFSKLAKHLPGLLEGLRLAGGLYFNNKIYNDKLKGINPNLKLSYHTYRNIVGDEGTKQAYYRRAAQGQTKAAKPVTSDLDRLVAYLMESKRAADDLRALGDLADNAEIKRTSDESNQHAWANTQRDTEVANWNREQLVNTAAAKADLLALKHAADWSSWNNYSLALETRLRLKAAQLKAFDLQIKISELLAEMEDDPEVVKAYERLLLVEKENTKDGITDWAAVQNSEAYKAHRKALREAKKRYYEGLRDYLLWAKKGSKLKVSTKTTDDLLYKAARDTVTHFRKMSKMSNDSTLKSRERGFKLTPHPKTPKYNTGGVAPFTVFTPAAVGGSLGVSSEFTDGSGALGLKSSSGEKDSSLDKKGKELLDLTKELFNKLDGLPVDVKMVANLMLNFLYRTKIYGKELDTTDIAQLYMLYVSQVSSIKHSKDVFDKAKTVATENGALGEIAVTADGLYIVQTKEGAITSATLLQIKESKGELNPLTNGNLLNLRATSPGMMLSKGDYYMDNVVNNGIGMSKILDKIKSIMPNLGSTELTIEGYTHHESQLIIKGFELLKDAPAGDYKYTQYTKDLKQQMTYALNFIKNSLPKNMEAVLNMHAYRQGTTVDALIGSMLNAGSSSLYKMEYDAVTGKASKDANGNSKSAEGSEATSAGLAFVLGQGPREVLELNTGTSQAIRVLGIRGTLQTHSNENLPQGSTLQEATKTLLGGYLKWGEATFGGSRLESLAYNHVILNNSTIMGMDLPYRKDLRGNTIPDLLKLKLVELAEEEIYNSKIADNDYAALNKVYEKYGLPPKYDSAGNLNPGTWRRFAAILATLDEKALKDPDGILSDEVQLANDNERELYELLMKSNNSTKDYELDDGFLWGAWGKDSLYKGTIFVPYDEDVAFAAVSSGKGFKTSLPDNADTVQRMQYAPATLSYKKPDVTLSQIMNK